MNSNFIDGWIPLNYYFKVVAPRIQGDYGKVSQLKSLSRTLFHSDLFPDKLYYVNGSFYDVNYKMIKNQHVKDVLFNNIDKIVFKADNAAEGKGIVVFNRNTFNVEKTFSLGNGVFQSYIKQHSFFKEFMPNSVATMRFTTIIDNNGNSQLRGCYLRLGLSKDTHIKSDSNIRVPVNIDNGELYEKGTLSNWQPILKHPDTNLFFSGKKIPNFDTCKNTALSLHDKFPFSKSVGWDIIVN